MGGEKRRRRGRWNRVRRGEERAREREKVLEQKVKEDARKGNQEKQKCVPAASHHCQGEISGIETALWCKQDPL